MKLVKATQIRSGMLVSNNVAKPSKRSNQFRGSQKLGVGVVISVVNCHVGLNPGFFIYVLFGTTVKRFMSFHDDLWKVYTSLE